MPTPSSSGGHPGSKGLPRFNGCYALRFRQSMNDCSPLLREPVGAALLDRALEGGARVHARQPAAEIGIGCELVEHFRHFADEAHLDIGAGERLPDEKFPALERAIDIAEMVCKFAVDARMQRRARLLQS